MERRRRRSIPPPQRDNSARRLGPRARGRAGVQATGAQWSRRPSLVRSPAPHPHHGRWRHRRRFDSPCVPRKLLPWRRRRAHLPPSGSFPSGRRLSLGCDASRPVQTASPSPVSPHQPNSQSLRRRGALVAESRIANDHVLSGASGPPVARSSPDLQRAGRPPPQRRHSGCRDGYCLLPYSPCGGVASIPPRA